MTRIVVLNGDGCVEKCLRSRTVQGHGRSPLLHVAMGCCPAMLPEALWGQRQSVSDPRIPFGVGLCVGVLETRLLVGSVGSVAAFAGNRCGHDNATVINGKDGIACVAQLSGFGTFDVALAARPAVIQSRRAQRRNRPAALSRAPFRQVHVGVDSGRALSMMAVLPKGRARVTFERFGP